MTHPELVTIGTKWLRNSFHCRVALPEPRGFTYWGERPDVIGWVGGNSILVECKTSVADYFADQGKRFRKLQGGKDVGLGNYRFYLTPEGLLDGLELPDGWGWYEVRGRRIVHAGGVKYKSTALSNCPFGSQYQCEIALLVGAMAKETDGKH